MNLPNFTAQASLYRTNAHYRMVGNSASSSAGMVVPAIPSCRNCDAILDRCIENGGHPRAVCAACAVGRCSDGVENPPPGDPFPGPPRWLW